MPQQCVTGTPGRRHINGIGDLKARNPGPNSVLVIFDDVAETGDSLDKAFRETVGIYHGDVMGHPCGQRSHEEGRGALAREIAEQQGAWLR